MKNLKTTLEFPSSIYYADKYAAVRSILGNDVAILNIVEQPIILPDNIILVDVEYSALDFNTFEVYKVLETKVLNSMSSENVITKLYSEISKTEITEIIKCPVKINVNDYVIIRYTSNANYAFQNSQNSISIRYYASKVSTSTILKSYCSIIDTSFLSYHGSTIPHTSIYDSKIKNISISKSASSTASSTAKSILNSLKDIDLQSNNFSKAKKTLSINSSQNIIEIDFNKFLNISENISDIYEINLKDCKYSDLMKLKNMTGIIYVSKDRSILNSFIFIPDSKNIITEYIIDNLILVLEYDTFNYELLNQSTNS